MNKDDQRLKKKFSNRIIIVDEAHNLRIQTSNTQANNAESKRRYWAFHRFFHIIENSKKILLTGTPMFDRITELPGILNLLLPLDEQITNFTKTFLTSGGPNGARKFIHTDELKQFMVGRVSFIREGGNFPTRIDLGEPLYTQYLHTVQCEMSNFQYKGYLEAWKKDRPQAEAEVDKGNVSIAGLWKNTRQAAVFVYKNARGDPIWGARSRKNARK